MVTLLGESATAHESRKIAWPVWQMRQNNKMQEAQKRSASIHRCFCSIRNEPGTAHSCHDANRLRKSLSNDVGKGMLFWSLSRNLSLWSRLCVGTPRRLLCSEDLVTIT